MLLHLLLLACSPDADDSGAAPITLAAMPDPADWSTRGPGGPQRSFSTGELGVACAWLNGGEQSAQHHNLVAMHDGYLLFPWSPEDGTGGISFFDVSDPCAPVKVGEAFAEHMRETHTLATGRVGEREYLAVDSFVSESQGGIGFFDITDPTDPQWVSELDLPGFSYPDAYFRVSLSTTWVGDRLYVAAGLLGVFVIDVSDPLQPVLLDNVVEVGHVAGVFHVIGNLGLSSSAGIARFITYDIGHEDGWQVLSDQNVGTPEDELENFYFSSVGGEYMLFARKDNGGGPIVYSLEDPAEPTLVGTVVALDGDGGYVYRHGDLLFQGESEFAAWYSFEDPADIHELGRVEHHGDVDTVTPIGNVAVVSTDELAVDGQSTGIYPWAEAPDTDPPTVRLSNPADGATWVPLAGNVGVVADELLEPRSAHAGSFRVWAEDGSAVPGRFYVMETVVNFVPDAPLAADTTYWVELPAGGLADSSGTPTDSDFRFAFSTGEEVTPWP
ncbi:Ig-like domain-containing protein [Myxococcota bacterium]|nr:Ig-like domain-containing protein [Myxococcota bacterium]